MILFVFMSNFSAISVPSVVNVFGCGFAALRSSASYNSIVMKPITLEVISLIPGFLAT